MIKCKIGLQGDISFDVAVDKSCCWKWTKIGSKPIKWKPKTSYPKYEEMIDFFGA